MSVMKISNRTALILVILMLGFLFISGSWEPKKVGEWNGCEIYKDWKGRWNEYSIKCDKIKQ